MRRVGAGSPPGRTAVRLLALATLLAVAPLATAAQFTDKLRPEHRRALQTLQPQIDAAIDKGVDFLLDTQLRDGSWGYEQLHFATGQTALCAYTLMKSGLPSTHSAVQRALTFITGTRPVMVYAAGCQLLALVESGDPAYREHIEAIAQYLVDLQDRGSWGYPNDRGELTHLHGDRDLSITQFAMLGLWAAARSGVEIRARTWSRALDAVIEYQEKPRRVEHAGSRSGRTSSAEREVAGFRYRWSARTAPSGSITTAGVAVLAIARGQLETRLRATEARAAEAAIDRGLAWLDQHYTVTDNPGGGREWTYYYLYGLERVGALLDDPYVGEHPWYLDGARELLRLQKPEGNWEARRNVEPDTCFAILFLKRATAPTTGRKARDPHLSVAEDPSFEVAMRGRGGVDGSPLDLWLTRIGKPEPDGRRAPAPIVARVEYLIDDDVVAAVDGDPTRTWRGEGYHARHTFAHDGEYRVSARVHVLQPVPGRDEPRHLELLAPGFTIRADHVLEPWMLDAARASAANELVGVDVAATASSTWDDGHRASDAADQLEATAWCCAPDDPEPMLELEFSNSMRTRRIVLHQAGGQRGSAGHFDRIERILLKINRQRKLLEVDLEPDERKPTIVDLPKPTSVRRIEVTVIARAPGSRHRGVGGFSEILLLD